MTNRIQFRRDTAANWTAANPVLTSGEPAWETDTKKSKQGDGTTAWNTLPYTYDPTDLFSVKDFGAKGDGVTDDSAAFVAANDAAAQVNGTVIIPGSATAYIVDNLNIPNEHGHWRGTGSPIQGSTYGGALKAGAVLRRKASSTHPLLTLAANGIQLENLYLDGNRAGGATGTGLAILLGFETKLTKVFVEYVEGIGIDFQAALNTNFYDVFVNMCGTTAGLPAVQLLIGATSGAGMNTVDFAGLTIEQPRSAALNIGVGAMDVFPEFLRIDRLHMELDNNVTGVAANTGPLINVGNARSICFVNPFIVGGPGPLIQYNRTQGALGDVLGGLQIIGGSLVGRSDGSNTSATLVNLVAGNGFLMVGTRVLDATAEAVKVQSTFGGDVQLNGISAVGVANVLTDLRAAPSVRRSYGDYVVDAHLSAGSTAVPTVAAGAQAGTSPPTPTRDTGSNDVRGGIFFGSGTGPAVGAMFTVTFARAYASAPTVMVTAGNVTTANLGPAYTSSTTGGFTVYLPSAPAASQGASTYFMKYSVMG